MPNALIGDACGDLGADPEVPRRFVRDEQSIGRGHLLENGRHVERSDGTQVDDVARNSLQGSLTSRRSAYLRHSGVLHNNDIRSASSERGLTDRDQMVAIAAVALHPALKAVLHEDDRVGVPN